MTKTALILVDTNVILYTRDGRSPAKQRRCAAWLSRLAATRTIVISPQTASEHQVNAQRKLGENQGDAARITREFLAWCPMPAGSDVILRAIDIEYRWKLNWWDAMQVAYAAAAGCTHLLTEDAQSAPVIEGVAIIDPFHVSPEDILGAA
jgi:predicted nucleic acid-binding protein